MSIRLQRAESVYEANHGWLQSRFYYSFADYYDPDHMSFGPMRVLNDDIIQAERGFGMHPHREMEIVTIVLSGHLAHADSKGHQASTTFGQIQRMSAGTGIMHSEMNPSRSEEVNLLQMWFVPGTSRLEPSYEQTDFDISAMKNALLPVVSNHSGEKIAHIHQDLTIYLSDLEEGNSLRFEQAEGRRMYALVLDGELRITGSELDETLKRRDAARIEKLNELSMKLCRIQDSCSLICHNNKMEDSLRESFFLWLRMVI